MVSGSTFQSRASSATWSGFVPVAEAGQLAVGAALAGVLRRGLAVHLEDAAAGLADQAADQVEVVDLARGGRRLVRLVDALEDRRDERSAPCRGSRRPPRSVAAGTPVISSTRSGVYVGDGLRAAPRSRPCGASMNARSMRPSSITRCSSPFSTATLVPSRGARWTSASAAVVGVARVDHDQLRRVRAAPGGRGRASRARSACEAMLWPTMEDRVGQRRCRRRTRAGRRRRRSRSGPRPRSPCRAACCRPCAACRGPPCR